MTDALVTIPLGAILGFLMGLTGAGGGALVALSLYVILGLRYGDSVALSVVYSLFTKIVGAAQHIRQGTVLWKITCVYGIAGIPGERARRCGRESVIDGAWSPLAPPSPAGDSPVATDGQGGAPRREYRNPPTGVVLHLTPRD